jgi:DNA repair protein RadA/Sms
MLGSGLREVSNPSEILISHKDEELSETPSPQLRRNETVNDRNSPLVSTAVYGTPQRSTQRVITLKD